ncbi:MAG: YfcE family phosphodiesterase [Firmicutes bacterium]|nr:YfcE family phosphodiesterase [Bacillota bacterium]
MRLGLVSDSHGELENLRAAAARMVREWRVDAVAHLGDECEDAVVLEEFPGPEVIKVPGVFCEHYRDPAIPNRLVRELGGRRVLFTHTPASHANDLPGDPRPEELAARREVDVVAYGHTHVPLVEEREGVLWVNPGHLKERDKRGHAPSFAVVDLAPERVEVRLVDLAGGAVVTHFVWERR